MTSMNEPKELDLESQEWVSVKSQEDLEKELLLLKAICEKEKKEKEVLKQDVNSYLKETVETLKQVDFAVLNACQLKTEQKKINQCAKQSKSQKKREKLHRRLRRNVNNEISELEIKVASLQSAVTSKEREQTWGLQLNNHLDRILKRRDEEIKEKNNEIQKLMNTLSQKNDEITKLCQLLNEKKPYSSVAKIGNFSVLENKMKLR
jgi:chromosome segregation ATPase